MSAPKKMQLEPHVCLVCFGRVVSFKAKGDVSVYCCSNCGAQGEGTARSICACGARIGGRDAGLRCVANDKRTLEFPSEIVAKEV